MLPAFLVICRHFFILSKSGHSGHQEINAWKQQLFTNLMPDACVVFGACDWAYFFYQSPGWGAN